MRNSLSHKIVLLEADQARRDRLKSAIQSWGFKSFSFDNELICLENIQSLDPDLVISGDLTTNNAVSFINSLKMFNYGLPILLFSGDRCIQDYIKLTGLSGIRFVRKNIPPDKIKKLINKNIRRYIDSRKFQIDLNSEDLKSAIQPIRHWEAVMYKCPIPCKFHTGVPVHQVVVHY